jgi:hypothetical protein
MDDIPLRRCARLFDISPRISGLGLRVGACVFDDSGEASDIRVLNARSKGALEPLSIRREVHRGRSE